jgi:predicted Fe-Mo cluster-binding NifX family protein
MRVAVTEHQSRVSPVFDVARRVVLAEFDPDSGAEDGLEIRHADLAGQGPLERARELSLLEVDVVVCGAISPAMAVALQSAGIELLSGVCGPVDEVLATVRAGGSFVPSMVLPGGCGQRRRMGRGNRRRGGPAARAGGFGASGARGRGNAQGPGGRRGRRGRGSGFAAASPNE